MANSRFGRSQATKAVLDAVTLSTTFEPDLETQDAVLDLLVVSYASTPSDNTLIKLIVPTIANTLTTVLYTIPPAGLDTNNSLVLTDDIFIPKGGRIEVDLGDQNANIYYRTSKA